MFTRNFSQEPIATQESLHLGDSPVWTFHDNHSDNDPNF